MKLSFTRDGTLPRCRWCWTLQTWCKPNQLASPSHNTSSNNWQGVDLIKCTTDNWCFSDLMICERMTLLTGKCPCCVRVMTSGHVNLSESQCNNRLRKIGKSWILSIITHLQVQTVPCCCDGGISAVCTRFICLSHFRERCGRDCFRGALSRLPACFVSKCATIYGIPILNILMILNRLHRFNTYHSFEMVLSHNYEISLK